MSVHKNKLQYLLLPSLASGVLCLLLSIAGLALAGFSYQAGKGSLYNFLFGKGSSAETITSSRSTLGALNDTVLGNPDLNKILYFAFWMIIGLIVYIILYAFLRSTDAAAENLKEANYANIKRDDLFENFAIRLAVRLSAIFGWIIFTTIFMRVLLPFSNLAARNLSDNIFSLQGLLYGLMGLVVLFLSLHIEVILFRLIFLRVRLFSQQEV